MTDRLRAAAQAALEALDKVNQDAGRENRWWGVFHAEIEQLRAALAEPEPCWCDRQQIGEHGVSCGDCPTRDYKQASGPVAWQYVWSPGMCFTTDSLATLHNYVQGAEDRLPPEKRGYVRALYTTPPRREWVGLTDEERQQILDSTHPDNRWTLAERVEYRLKERNA